jgi:hypothetical protein
MILGILLFVAFLLTICTLSEVTKFAGWPFLYLPSRLGILPQAERADTLALPLNKAPSTLEFTRTGRYAVYAIDYDLLQITDMLAEKDAEPWLRLQAPDGQEIHLNYVRRGLRPYDTPFLQGRPIFSFKIDQPGVYTLIHPARPVSIGLTPDYTTGHEKLIVFLFVAQFAILAWPLFLFFRRQSRKQAAKIKEVRQLKKIKGDIFTQTRLRR